MYKLIFLFISLLSFPTLVFSKIQLSRIFSDNLVLQQLTNVAVWGESNPFSEVEITTSWNKNKIYKTKADEKGKWKMKIVTPKAINEPQSIIFSDGEELIINNILIGEVWFCSGQSNMEMPLCGFQSQPINDALDLILNAKPTRPIRTFTVERKISNTPLTDCIGEWKENTPETISQCSATAYYFADYLNRILDIPIGIIISSWGGTYIQPWMSRDCIEPLEYDMKHLDSTVLNDSQYPHNKPSRLFNGMIAPILPYTIKGMIWYQGESNCNDPKEYEILMPIFVDDLRKKFEINDFPFYYVQIAPNHYNNEEKMNAPELRLVQSRMMDRINNSGMVVTMDIGDNYIIHPPEKKTIGKRLAYWALAKDYGKNSYAYSGPIYSHMTIDGHKAYLYFKNTAGGISPLGRDLGGFEMAGTDGIYYRANAYIDSWSKVLTVTCDSVNYPVNVRYGYADYIVGTLFDNFGLPASPFNTADY